MREYFARIYRALWFERNKDWIFHPFSPDQYQGVQAPQPELVHANQAYLTVKLRSMRIVNVRRGLRRFFPVVNSFVSLSHEAGEVAEFPVVTTAGELGAIDANNVDRVLQLNQTLLDHGAYRGNALELEIGLFSVEFADLAEGFVGLLTQLAELGGTKYLKVASPFVAPIRSGIHMLTRTQGDSILEIGLRNEFDPVNCGLFLVMRAEKANVDPTKLRVQDNDFRVVDQNGRPIEDSPYFVFSISSSPQRHDWHTIPELTQAYGYLREQVTNGKNKDIQQALDHFRLVTL